MLFDKTIAGGSRSGTRPRSALNVDARVRSAQRLGFARRRVSGSFGADARVRSAPGSRARSAPGAFEWPGRSRHALGTSAPAHLPEARRLYPDHPHKAARLRTKVGGGFVRRGFSGSFGASARRPAPHPGDQTGARPRGKSGGSSAHGGEGTRSDPVDAMSAINGLWLPHTGLMIPGRMTAAACTRDVEALKRAEVARPSSTRCEPTQPGRTVGNPLCDSECGRRSSH